MTVLNRTLRKSIKWAVVVLLVAALMSIIFIIVSWVRYYRIEIAPYHAIVDEVLQTADAEHKNLAKPMQRALNIGFNCDTNAVGNATLDKESYWHPDNCHQQKDYVISRLIVRHKNERHLRGNIRRSLITYFAIRPLSDKDKNTVITELSTFPPYRLKGFNAFSQHYFNKTLKELNVDEALTLMALEKRPNLITKPKQLEQAKNRMLERYSEKQAAKQY